MVKKAFYSLVLSAMLVLSSCGGGLLGNILGLGNTNTNNNTASTAGSVLGILGSVLGGMGGNSGLGSIFGFTDNGSNLNDMVIGNANIGKSDLIGTWIYAQPGCAFTSQGGTSVANKVKQTLANTYKSLGFANNNTGFAFKQDGTYEAALKGVGFNGTYTYDPSSGKLNLKTSGGTIPTYVTRIGNGMSITMDSKVLVNVLQALGATGGNSVINNLASQYSGMKMGFDLAKYQ